MKSIVKFLNLSDEIGSVNNKYLFFLGLFFHIINILQFNFGIPILDRYYDFLNTYQDNTIVTIWMIISQLFIFICMLCTIIVFIGYIIFILMYFFKNFLLLFK